MRLPIYKFRPSHSDAMHIDIWKDGVNLVRDAGSYSYGLPITEQEKFSGTKGHSTIQFDNRNQMPRISRFLYGEWLNPIGLDCNLPKGVVRAEYLDYYGARHIREVSAIDKGWKIIDNISGKFNTAIQRWILAPNDWVMDGYSISSGNVSISMITENIKRFEIISSVESLYYMVQSSVPVLEVELLDNCKIETLIIFQA